MTTLNLDKPATQREFASIIGVGDSAVSKMVSDGVIAKGRPVGEWIHDYCAHMREIAAGRMAAGELDLAGERARLAKEQADRLAMQNAITRRELAPVVILTEVLAKSGAKISGILETIPGHVRRRLPDLPASEIEAIQREIAKARNLCAAIRLEDLDDPDQI